VDRRAVVVGGSLGGLTAALLLHEAGFAVSVHERSAQLADRGAGIVAHPESLRYLLERGLVHLDEVSILCGNLRYLDRDGRLVSDEPSGYRFTSWFALYARLLDRLSQRSMHFAEALYDFSEDADEVTVRFSGGGEERCDLLVCADGIASTARHLLLPDVEPVYSGYIGWRGTVPLTQLDPRLRASLGDHMTYQLLDSGHTLANPIPDSRGPASNEGPFLNWIWYRRLADGAEVTRAMTDSRGRHHDLSVPPGAVAAAADTELRKAASTLLSDDLAALVLITRRPSSSAWSTWRFPRWPSAGCAWWATRHSWPGPTRPRGPPRRPRMPGPSPTRWPEPTTSPPGCSTGNPVSSSWAGAWCGAHVSWATRSSAVNGLPATTRCSSVCAPPATPALIAPGRRRRAFPRPHDGHQTVKRSRSGRGSNPAQR
jgi:2,6-dihydroxypyridine 3-monooxygenase